jgi:acyl-CoA thioesterase FadM
MSEERIDTIRIVSRGYELASHGTLPVAAYLRYLEHLRWRTISRSQKIPLRLFWTMGVVRAQVLELHTHVSFDVELELSMWVSRVGRTSIELSHDVTRTEDGVLVARSTATIVTLDDDRRPAPVKDGAREFVVERPCAKAERLEFEAPLDAWRRSIDIRPSDQDLQQHVNQARYADFVEDARLLCARAGGYGSGDWEAAPRRFVVAYESEARVGDAVQAVTWRSPERDRTAEFVLRKENGQIVTRARVELGKSTDFPQ